MFSGLQVVRFDSFFVGLNKIYKRDQTTGTIDIHVDGVFSSSLVIESTNKLLIIH